jgi:secondary thiamine-phosphate synthase enzyme
VKTLRNILPNLAKNAGPRDQSTSMKVFQISIDIATSGRGLIDITSEVNDLIEKSGIVTGLCTVFVQHTSASLLIQENADPSVRRDLEDWFGELAPETRRWRHDDEGPDDMPAHARSSITRTSEVVPITLGRLALGTWQGLYLWEHRTSGHRRRLVVHVQGESQSERVRETDQERLATVGQLVASIGHELRNPLSAIETSAYLLTQRLGAEVAAEPTVSKHLEKIRHQVGIATKTVADLLELAKNRPPARVAVELLPLLETAMEYLHCPRAVSIVVEVDRQLVVWADPDQLRIVVVNLLTNALDAIGAQGTITVAAERSDDGVALYVTDDGPGVAVTERERLFEVLYTTKPKGHGLGLPLCRRIALAHGGDIRLLPSERGATFRLWIPGAKFQASAGEQPIVRGS